MKIDQKLAKLTLKLVFFLSILNTFYWNPRTLICFMVLLGTQKYRLKKIHLFSDK